MIRFSISCIASAIVFSSFLSAQAPIPSVSGLRFQGGALERKIEKRLGRPAGDVEVVIRLSDAPLAGAAGFNARRIGFQMTAQQQRAYLQQLGQKQTALMNQIAGLGGREIARLSKASNALIVRISASRLQALNAMPNVASVRPVMNYRRTLSSVNAIIGATALHNSSITGAGRTIAILDSGIDYTHRNFGGPGTVAAYRAAYGLSADDPKNQTTDGLFPTAKVVGGFDFVGEQWPAAGLQPDPDPIDFEGHGTHVADIAAGRSADGRHKGVAPGASLLAVKVCSAISTSCSGIAALMGLDFAIDPNVDGNLSDAADVVNMSLGLAYGQREDDLVEAVKLVTRLGVVVVVAAGNDGDRPYIVGSPSVAPSAISVAETQVSSAFKIPLVIAAPPAIAGTYGNTETLSWAPVGAGFVSQPATYVGRGCPAGSIEAGEPADPYLANPAGKVALIDRGACDISAKVDRAAKAGAVGVLIGLIAPGDAVSFSKGLGDTFVPSLVIRLDEANLIKTQLNAGRTVLVSVSDLYKISLGGSIYSASSRGPGYSYASIKPDIGAPGASVSAIAGTGNREDAFSGTSGASPVVAGSAALLLQVCPACSPTEIKAKLMNTAETNILINPATQPGVAAPITRIGGGEVRINRAAAGKTAAWDAGDPESVSLAFGTYRINAARTYKKKIVIRNYAAAARTYAISTNFRYAADTNGAVSLSTPPSVSVPANSSATLTLSLTVNPTLLPEWSLNGGLRGGDGFRLQDVEFDGYLTIADATDTVRLPWHFLPHKAAQVRPSATTVSLSSPSFALTNIGGATTGFVDVFSLTGTSPQVPAAALPRTGDNYAIVDLKAVGVRLVQIGPGEFGIQFAVNTYGERSHPNYPGSYEIYIDLDLDGNPEYIVFNQENGGVAESGQNLVGVYNVATRTAEAFFYTIADLNSSNAILTAPLAAMELTPGRQFGFSVYGADNYFTGVYTDAIENMIYTPNTPRYVASGVPAAGIPIGGSATLNVGVVRGGSAASPSQTGLLLLYPDALTGREADAIVVTP